MFDKYIPLHISVLLENSRAWLKGYSIRFRLNENGDLFAVEDSHMVRLSDKTRGFWLYRAGVSRRLEWIMRSYCLTNLTFSDEDIIIDCGANIGELFLALSKKINPWQYYAFEPNPSDFVSLTDNVRPAKNLFNKALGKFNMQSCFYTSTTRGDSSLIEPLVYDGTIVIDVVRLDQFIISNSFKRVKLLKLEAEGYEPEILDGLGNMISLCEYISIDGGYERGKECEQTFSHCTNYLISNGFELVDIYFPACRALFRNKNLIRLV